MQDKQEELGTEENGGVAVLFKGLTEITKEFANLTDSANDKWKMTSLVSKKNSKQTSDRNSSTSNWWLTSER